MLIVMSVSANAQVMTNLVYQELDKVDVKSKTVVIAGKPYQYRLDVEGSSYRFEDDAKTSRSLNQLKTGEKYYFQLMAKGDDIKRQNYKYVIFISESKPSE